MRKIIQDAAAVFAALIACTMTGCSGSGDVQSLMAKAQQYRQKSDYKAAVIELKNVLQKNPEQAEARYILGITYNDMADYLSADKELHRALELNYDKSTVIAALGKSLVMQGAFQKVLDEVQLDARADSRIQAEVLTLRALALIGLGRAPEGRELLEQALAKQPEFADALLAQARLAAGDKKLDDAARLTDRAIASAPKSTEAWLMKGDLGRMTDDQAGARAAYQKVLDFSPDNLPARLNIAMLDIADGNIDVARKQIAQVRKIYPNNVMALHMQGLVEYRAGNHTAAREAMQQVLTAAPDYMPSVLLAAAVDFALGSYAQAEAYAERVLAGAPNNLYARKLLIGSLAKSGQVQRALDVLQAGLKLAPEDSALMGLAGDLYMQSGKFSKAMEYFELAAKRDPKNAGVRTQLGLSRLALGETDSAFTDLESASQLDSHEYRADIVLVASYLKRGNYDQALKALQSLEKKQPDNPLTYNLKGAIYIGKKDAASARKQFEHALELQPTYVPSAVNLAHLDLRDKNPRAARGRLEAILKKEKDNVQALFALADLGPQIGATQKEQVGWLERAGRASPGSVEPQLALARLYARTGDAKKALEVAQQALAGNPDNPQVLDMVGAAQIHAGQREQALATYGALAKVQPDSPGALYSLATAQAVNGDEAAARSTLRKALLAKPDFIAARTALIDLEVRAGHFPEAIQNARQVQKASGKSPIGFVLEGDVMMAQKRFAEALTAYQAANRIRRSGALAIKLHNAYMQTGKPREAEAQLANWLNESPNDAEARLYDAEVSLKSGKFKNAIEQYEWLQQKQPDNMLVLNNLAWAYQQVKDPRALETAERAYKLSPNAATGDTLGWILVEQSKTARGLELLQQAVGAAPNSPTIRYHFAYASFKAGDKSKARDELERLLASDAKFPQQAEAMGLLKQLRD